MDELQELISDAVRKNNKSFSNLPAEERTDLVVALSEATVEMIIDFVIQRAPKMLNRRRKIQSGFELRNFRRWRKAFDLAETLRSCCEEIGFIFHQNFQSEALKSNDYVFSAITSIHARSLLVTAEIICLMKGGFADAALTRWRTLYELNVVATLIAKEGQDLAIRYILHADVQAAKELDPEALEEYKEVEIIKQRAEYAIDRFGKELNKRFGWACALTGKEQPTFEHLEVLAGKSDDRPLYKHASQHIHSNHRTHDQFLGASESEQALLLVGPSNSGMTTPLRLVTKSMVDNTTILLGIKPSFDHSIYTLVLIDLASRMHELAEKIEYKSLKAARKRERRKAK